MANHWFKFYGGDYLSDPKMLALSPLERSCWLTILSLASISDPPGIVKHLTEEKLITMAGGHIGSDETVMVLHKLSKLTMITLHDNGTIEVNNWLKRQNRVQTPYERVKRYRTRHGERNDDNGDDNARIEESRIDKNRVIYTLFDEFWALYPRKVGKQAALRAWMKIEDPIKVMPQIRASLESHKNSRQWLKDGGEFIPHAATWLNGRRWEDEVGVEIKKPNVLKLN